MAYIQIQWTTASREEAKKISTELVKKKWVACANIIPEVDSIYLWDGKVHEEKEVKVFLKTKDQFYNHIQDYIIGHSSYEVPEISKVILSDANPEYLRWLEESLSEHPIV